MIRTWQLQEAKNRLSRVIDDARDLGPQTITRHGRPVAVVMSFEEYRRAHPVRGKLSAFFRRSPMAGLDLDPDRADGGDREGFRP